MKFYNGYPFFQGQGQVPTNWIREENHDIIAFPELYPDGTGGVNAKRQVKLCKTDFFSTKFLNKAQDLEVNSQSEDINKSEHI